MGAARPTARPSPVHPRGCRAASRPVLARGTRPSCTAACPTSACRHSVPEWPWPRPESTVTPTLRARRATAPSLGAADTGLRAAEGRRAPLGARHAARGSRSTHTSDGLQPAGPPDREGPVLAALGSGGWAPTADKACVTPSRPVHLCPAEATPVALHAPGLPHRDPRWDPMADRQARGACPWRPRPARAPQMALCSTRWGGARCCRWAGLSAPSPHAWQLSRTSVCLLLQEAFPECLPAAPQKAAQTQGPGA